MSEDPDAIRPRPVPSAGEPEQAAGPRPRHARPEGDAGRSGRALGWAGRTLAVLCVGAGVAVFVVARSDGSTPATPRPAGSHASTTPGPVADDRALLTDPSTAQAYVAAATSEIVIVSNSDYRDLDNTLSAGLSVTTGAFQTRFRDALTGASAQARRASHNTTDLDVLQVGIGQVSRGGDEAKVLVFGRLHQGGDNVDAGSADTVVTLCLTLVRNGNQFLISDLEQGTNAGLPPGTTGLNAAAEAARSEIVNILTYSRADFAADLARAQQGATGLLRSQLANGAAALQARLGNGKYDLSGAVTSIAARQVAGESATFLVAASSTQIMDAGQAPAPAELRYVVSVQRVSGTWLVSSATPVT